MKKTNMIATVSVLIALVCATLFFFNWNPEVLFKLNEPMVSMSDIEQNITTDFIGSPAGSDIPRLNGAEDFSEIIYLADLCDSGTGGDCPNRYFQSKPMGRPLLYTKSERQNYWTPDPSTGDYFIRLGFAGQLSALLSVRTSGSYLYRGTNSTGNSEGNRKRRKRHAPHRSENRDDRHGSKSSFCHL